jgi:TRAP-type mannitol/chloroaromatic compound transport system substrate-binding protein
MKRRAFLGGAGVAGMLAAPALPRPALAQGRIEWRMATAWPRAAEDLIGGGERLAQRIGQMSDGRLTVKVLAAGELVAGDQVFDAVSQGRAELGHGLAHDHLSKTVGSAFFAAVPFGLAAAESAAWIEHGGGQALWDELYAAFNVKPFPAGNTGPRPLGWFRRELKSTADLKGLKLSMPGWGGRLLLALGAEPVSVAPGELAAALKSGAIDGAGWSSLLGDRVIGLFEAAKLCYLPGVQAPGTQLEFLANKQKWDGLAQDLKAVLRAAAAAGHLDIASEQAMRSARALELLKETRGVRVLKASNELLAGLGEAAGRLLAQERDKADPVAKRIFASYLQARSQLMPFERGLNEANAAARELKYRFPS